MRTSLLFVLLFAACSSGGKDSETDDTTGYTDPGPPDSDTDTDVDSDTDADADADSDADADADADADTDTDTGMPLGLDIVGTYTDAFGAEHEITESDWTYAYPSYPSDTFAITQYDNIGMYVIAQNGPKNAYSAGLWSRFDWAWDGTELYYCQTAFAEATEGDALAVAASDSTDPATAGCGAYDFPWTLLTP